MHINENFFRPNPFIDGPGLVVGSVNAALLIRYGDDLGMTQTAVSSGIVAAVFVMVMALTRLVTYDRANRPTPDATV